jgi:multiple sugar transport system substrate-binding protein
MAIGCIFAGLAGLLAGCRRSAPPPPPPHQGVVLRVACPEAAAELVRRQAPHWAARQQARVEVVSDYAAHQGPGPAAGADVWVLRYADLPRWAAAGRLAPVPEALKGRDAPYRWEGLLPLYRERLLVWAGLPYGVPLLGESTLCCYRADWFADEERQQAYAAFQKKRGQPPRPLLAPATWEDYADLAEFFRQAGPAAKPGPSLPALPKDDEALDRLFYQVAVPFVRRAVGTEGPAGADHLDEVFSFHYDLKTGAPHIASPGFVHALRLLLRLQACRPALAQERPQQAFAEGRAALCLSDASWLVAFQARPELRDKFGICAVPGAASYYTFKGEKKEVKGEGNRVPYLGSGGWAAVVPRSAGHAEAAWDLLASLSCPEGSAQVALEPRWGGGPVRQGQLNRERWGAFDLDRARGAAVKDVLGKALLHHGLKNPVLCLRTPDQSARRSALVAEVRAALEGKKRPEEALQEAARRWAELDGQKGLEATKAEYRLSLGLLAR